MTPRELIYLLREQIGTTKERDGDKAQLAALESKRNSAVDMPQGQCRPAAVAGSAWGNKKLRDALED